MMKRTEKMQSQQQAEEHRQRQAEEQSQQQAREEHSQRRAEKQSQQQAKQTKGLRPRQGEVRGEVHNRGKASVSQPVPKHPRTDANVQQGSRGKKELKLEEGIAKIPEIDFNEEIVEYKRIIQAAQQLKTATTS